MFKHILLQITQSALFQKIVAWIKGTGLTSLFYIAIVVGIWIVPLGPLKGLRSEISAGAGAIFIYINWNIIRKLWKGKADQGTGKPKNITLKVDDSKSKQKSKF